jgi:hypothetical protein
MLGSASGEVILKNFDNIPEFSKKSYVIFPKLKFKKD